MKYPLFKVHVDSDAALLELSRVLKSGYLNEGEAVKKFLELSKKKFKTNNVALTNSCTSALTIALKLCGVKFLDDVISTPMTCVATNSPIVNLGADILWADVDPTTGCISPDSVDEIFDRNPGSVKAVMSVAWAGNPPNLEALNKVCKRNGAKLILDAAHAYGSTYKGKPLHEWADMTCYSFQAIKHVTSGDGGAIICKDSADLKRATKLKWFGIDRDDAKDSEGNWKGQTWDFDIEEAGYKFNMNNISAAIGLSQEKYIDRNISAHMKNAATYDKLFETSTYAKPISKYDGAISSHWVYTLLLQNAGEIDKFELFTKLKERGVEASTVHVPNNAYSCFKDFAVADENLAGLLEFDRRQFSLPCGWWMNESDVKEVFTIFQETYESML